MRRSKYYTSNDSQYLSTTKISQVTVKPTKPKAYLISLMFHRYLLLNMSKTQFVTIPCTFFLSNLYPVLCLSSQWIVVSSCQLPSQKFTFSSLLSLHPTNHQTPINSTPIYFFEYLTFSFPILCAMLLAFSATIISYLDFCKSLLMVVPPTCSFEAPSILVPYSPKLLLTKSFGSLFLSILSHHSLLHWSHCPNRHT